jgi:hypothetical protein
MEVMDLTRNYMGGFFPIRRVLDHGYGILGQRYYGDVNIIAKYGLRHYNYMLKILDLGFSRFCSKKVSEQHGQKSPQ